MKYRDWLEKCERELQGAGLFFGHGTGNSRDEAAWLVLAATGHSVDGSFDGWDEPVTENRAREISRLLELRVGTRQPLAYLLGEAWFCGLKFFVNPHVLVPRSPLGELIANGFSPWMDAEKIRSALDLCTGCGCIGIAIAKHMPWISLDAADISVEALQVAARNRDFHRVSDRLELVHSDLFSSLSGRRYDLVITNPPYVSRDSWEILPAEYHAEPRGALVSELEGLELPLKILLQSPDHLHEDGVLICEVGENAGLLAEFLPELPLTWLEFEHGGKGVLYAEREDLIGHRDEMVNAMERLRNVP